MWYFQIFSDLFPDYNPDIYTWMPKWVEANDPSARVIYNGADKDQM